jgi:hypothetical protein
MSLIRVTPPELLLAAREIDEIAQGYRGLADRALRATQGAPSYDNQFGPQVRTIGDEAHARLSTYASRLSELSQELARIAAAFERADLETLLGLQGLGLSIEAMSGASFENPLLRLFLGQMHPPNFSAERWAMLPMEDRLAVLGALQSSLVFIVGASTVEGAELYVINPLRIRRDPGMGGDVLAYAEPGSTVVWTGEEREIDGTVWYAVTYVHPIMGLVTGWVSSLYLKDGEYRVGYGPETVAERFTIQENQEVMESGGSLMAVSSDWLVILDGPTWEYGKAADPVEWGGVVRWTGRYIEEGGHTWYEVTCWKEGEDGNLEPTIGWTRGDRVVDYMPHPETPTPHEGYIYAPRKEEWNASHYHVVNIDAYTPPINEPQFASSFEIKWAEGFAPDVQVPNVQYGTLFSADGVAMQGSGMVLIDDEPFYFELDNPEDLHWLNKEGHPTRWEDGKYTNGHPYEVANPEVAEFRPGSKAEDFIAMYSAAGPQELRGATIFVPELMDFSARGDGVFQILDAGGAFGPGEARIDVFFNNYEDGLEWSNNTYLARRDGFTIYLEQPIPPEIDQVTGP